MSGSITFDEIPADWRVPGTRVEIRPNYRSVGVADYPVRALLIGPQITSANGVAGTPYRITRREDAGRLFGAGAILEAMVNAFFDANTTTEIWAMGLGAAVDAVAATCAIAITGTASAAGTLAIDIDGRRVTATIASGTTATAAGAALVAAIAADPRLPVTAANVTGTVTLTAKYQGSIGLGHLARLNPATNDTTPAGLSVAVPSVFSSGAGTSLPTVATALSNVAAEWFTDIAIAWWDVTSVGQLVADLARRYSALGKLDAHGYLGRPGTHGDLLSYGAALNSQHLSVLGVPATAPAPWSWGASLCARAAFYLTADPARQLRTLTLPGIVAPRSQNRFTETERDQLLRDGISTWQVVSGVVVLERVITTYQLSALGVADTAWLDITVPKTMSRIRYDWRTYLDLTYPRAKLADDDSPTAEFAENVATPRRVKGNWAARCALYERRGWIEDARRTVEESVFQRDPTDRNRMNAVQRLRLIGNLMVFAAALEFEV